LDSSGTSIDAGAARRLGELLSGTEARDVADRLDDGDTLTVALKPVAAGHRAAIRSLLEPGTTRAQIAVLRAVEGARSTPTAIRPLWTMPGNLARNGPLTSSVSHLVDGARQSITCSTFNFQRSSGLWTSLRRAAQRPGLALRIYLDTMAADQRQSPRAPTTSDVAEHLWPAKVMRTKEFGRGPVRNHAKFIAIDHRFMLVTSANLSWSAEYGNVELGLLIDDRSLTEAVEGEMLDVEELLYEPVSRPR
jgi:hypothetical protein